MKNGNYPCRPETKTCESLAIENPSSSGTTAVASKESPKPSPGLTALFSLAVVSLFIVAMLLFGPSPAVIVGFIAVLYGSMLLGDTDRIGQILDKLVGWFGKGN